MKEKRNTCGILSIIVGFLSPILGIILGVIALGRKEPKYIYGIIGIILSILLWVFSVIFVMLM
jgi:hypothetical protein